MLEKRTDSIYDTILADNVDLTVVVAVLDVEDDDGSGKASRSPAITKMIGFDADSLYDFGEVRGGGGGGKGMRAAAAILLYQQS